jgi:hypothetical protein
MSQIKFDKPLQINLRFSAIHIFYLCLLHCLAILTLLLPFDLNLLLRSILAGYVIASLYVCFSRAKSNYSGCLQYLETDNWIWLKGNKEYKLRLLTETIISSELVILIFSDTSERKHYRVLFPDSTDKETFRRLRILLRHSTADTHSSPV